MEIMTLPLSSDGVRAYTTKLAQYPVLSREQEQELAIRYHETGDKLAAQQLVLADLRFVVKIANEYKGYGLRLADLIQEGNIGLLIAVKKFDPHKGFRFISYAVWWIRAYIQNYILKSWSLVRIGTTEAHRKLFYKLRSAKQKLLGGQTGDLNRHLNEDEAHHLAESMALKESDIIEMDQRLASRDLSLNAPLSDDDAMVTHQDLLVSPENHAAQLEDRQIQSQRRTQVGTALQRLDPREQYIAEHRMMTDEPHTLQEIGDHFGISRERARQLEMRTKQKLRAALQTSH